MPRHTDASCVPMRVIGQLLLNAIQVEDGEEGIISFLE